MTNILMQFLGQAPTGYPENNTIVLDAFASIGAHRNALVLPSRSRREMLDRWFGG